MIVDVHLTSSRIPEPQPGFSGETAVGAWVEFRGVVRGEEDDRSISALEYEAYSPMAEREIRRLLEEIQRVRPCRFARVIHRIGIVPVGEAAIYVGIASKHRGEAFAMLTEFMDRLKQDVPIWKRRAVLDGEQEPASKLGPGANGKISPLTGALAHSAAEVISLIKTICKPLAAEKVSLAEAAGRVLRQQVCAPEDQPSFDRSSVDGYAVLIEDEAKRFQVVDEIRAGDWKPRSLHMGEAARIATGGALPSEGLQVLMKEDVRVEGGAISVLRREPDRNIRMRGEDALAGQVLVEKGTLLRAGTLGLLASAGCTQPLVTRRPRVLHLATGNEIVPPANRPERGKIRDSNSTLVRAFLGQWGILPEQRRLSEEKAPIEAAIPNQDESPALDLLLISGGASVGEHDFTRIILEQAGFTIYVSKTTARPGKPLIMAQRGGTLAFGLPGNPLAHFVCLNLYVRAALEEWAGCKDAAGLQKGVLETDLPASSSCRETFWPAKWKISEGIVTLQPLRWSSSGDLTALATANALIRVPPEEPHLRTGTSVQFISTEIAI